MRGFRNRFLRQSKSQTFLAFLLSFHCYQFGFPKIRAIPKFAQPIGAGYTLSGYHPDDVEGYFEMPVTRETRHIEAIAPVSGNSMYPDIHDGALVFIRPAKDFKDGDKLLVFLKESGELTLNRASRNSKISNTSYHIWAIIKKSAYILCEKFQKTSCETACKVCFQSPSPQELPAAPQGMDIPPGFSDETKKIYEYRDVEIQGVVVDWVNDRITVNEIIEKLKSLPQE